MKPGDPPANRLGVGDTCPFCGATSGVTESDDGYICIVCGSPRVVVEGVTNRGSGEKHLLVKSKTLRLKRAAWGAGGGVSAALGAFAALVSGIVAYFLHLGPVGLAFALTAVVIPVALSVFAFRRSRTYALQAEEALELAMLAVALRSEGSATPEELAKKLRVPVERAEELLALAQVERFLAEPDDALHDRRVRVESPLEPTVNDEAAEVDTDTRAQRGRQGPT